MNFTACANTGYSENRKLFFILTYADSNLDRVQEDKTNHASIFRPSNLTFVKAVLSKPSVRWGADSAYSGKLFRVKGQNEKVYEAVTRRRNRTNGLTYCGTS